ncbi:hypothetical protein D9619_008511 [Psilocybe cf. subviscida]|uniref:Uncharacterized protein n=1 Tax=Psilocybe cf. subviscida TaxID=2480587 RepID=A0A8H5BAJ7_9AGAR|nr:hypothetical protein D9619_008511 [Psilocybe cf. subviscida]
MEKAAEKLRHLLVGKDGMDKRRRRVKILLLGQAESGKSTVLKSFQLRFAPEHFHRERAQWRIIIYLNVIGSIKTVFDALGEEYEPKNDGQAINASMRVCLSARLGLSSLEIIEANILAVLAPECKDSRDMVLKSGSAWKTLLQTQQSLFSAGIDGQRLGTENDLSSILIAQKDEIEGLWLDNETQLILSRRRPCLRQSPGFFMDDISRILTPDYVPTDTDILRARIRTTGIEEHDFYVKKGFDPGLDYHMIEVGGSQSQRASWATFFNDVDAVVFLAPLLFNEFLEDDDNINRVEDSMLLWQEVCENNLLAKTRIVLFLNKVDILEATLRAGIQVNRYIASYRDQPNDLHHVTKYFRDKFHHFHTKYSPEHRPFFCHPTSAIDVSTTKHIVDTIRDLTLRQNLRSKGYL